MSISKNVGAVHNFLDSVRAGKGYNDVDADSGEDMEGGSWRSAGTFSGSRNGEACAVSAVSPVWSRGRRI